MRTTILQTDIAWGDPERNMANASALIGRSVESELYILPEMWSTGFATAPIDIADRSQQALTWMKQTARQTQAALCGSVAIQEHTEGQETIYRNRLYFVRPDGSFDQYDKHHLFAYGGEDLNYKAGNKRCVAEWKGWRFLLLTCYDLRFPIWARYQDDYDAIIVVANWPDKRQHAWNILTRARSIENQCYLIGCNRVGDDNVCHYIGQSVILDAKGVAIAESDSAVQQTITAELSMSDLLHFRNTFHVLDERDNKS